MASPQTVMLPIDIAYRDQNGVDKTRRCFLSLSLSIVDLDAATLSLEGNNLGEVTIQGAVMPVDDHPN